MGLLTGTAVAQPTTWVGFNAGAGFPIGSFADKASTGFNIGVVTDLVVRGPWSFGGELSWHGFGGNDDLEKQLSASAGVPVDYSVGIIPIVAHARYRVDANDPLVPFIRGGLGLYNFRERTESSLGRDDDASTDLGFLAGAGVEFSNWEGVAWGAELLYQYIATSNEASNLVTLRAQVLFGYPR
jgi:opacity protein-like surface antigen